jgi:hypothetical protein
MGGTLKPVPEPPNDGGRKTKSPNTNGETLDITSDEFFGIPSNAYISREILKRIKELIGDSDFNIQSVRQEQYQEIYSFQKGNEVSRVDINYNKKRKITRIAPPEQIELSQEIIKLISPLEGAVIPPTDLIDELFGIPPNAHDSIERLKKIKEFIENSDIKIKKIRKTGYQETYLFQKGNELSKADIYFNRKGRVTRIASPEQTELSEEIIKLISPLKGFIIPAIPITKEFVFEEKFLNDLHKQIRPLFEQQEITITDVEKLNYALRYTVIRSGENAGFDIYFNGKKQFTRFEPVKPLCNSTPLLDDIKMIIEELNQ